MDRMLGEVAAAVDVKEKDIVWIDDEYRAVVKVERFDNGSVRFTTLDNYQKFFVDTACVIRGHYYLGVARRVD